MSEEKIMISNPYDHLKSYDVISMLKPLIESGAYDLRAEDGKLKGRYYSISSQTPWVHVKHARGFNCGLWHQIIFNVIVKALPPEQRFVPQHCQSCWKVVVKPRTLQQLFNLHELQKMLDRPSKAGIETRESVNGLYGGYFYNKSKEEGLRCYSLVYNKMLENEALLPLLDEVDEYGRTTRVILKRGCTEFEHMIGDSSKWEITEEQKFVEELVEHYVVSDEVSMHQPEHVVWNIKRRWIEWAWKHGDPTYMRYTGGKPLYPPYVTYHQPELFKSKRNEILFRKF
jgi:hypothetical protein